MNREIKFRIWDKVWKEMSYIDLCDLAEGDDYWYDGETSVWEVMNDATSEQRRYVIQQYTGLKDKNGVEVFEGDIVMFDYEWTKPTEIGVVTWNNENASFQIKGHIPSSSMKHLDRMKVIGNIYEREVTVDPETRIIDISGLPDSFHTKEDTLYDLIKADLVEKVEDK